MQFTENEFRDYLFNNHKENISDLIVGRRNPVTWKSNEFPPLRFLLQKLAEQRINELLDDLESLVITARELPLGKLGDSTTRLDLFGSSERNGITIIELKKSKQTERQAFTELLAYANHFCSIFPGLKESSITSILIAPMETRTVRDAFVQELVANNKSLVALIPKDDNGKITLSVYYPDESYYQWFENNLLDDRSMLTVVIAFPIIEGWIDNDTQSENKTIPDYSKAALNTISNAISHRLESEGFHALVYASQKWGEIGQLFPYPNTICVAAINPFSSFRTATYEDTVYGESAQGRLSEIQSIYNQISDDERKFWFESMELSFHNRLTISVKEEFQLCFKNKNGSSLHSEISRPDWYEFKTNIIDSVCTHKLDIYLTGLLRLIYVTYISHIYDSKENCIFYHDDLPKYSYDTLRKFLPVWEILRVLGLGEEQA
ncbi:hypothetical protein H6G06_25265 [Anabaena sphaerica FACHB-251]|uniref:Uncharacterized protein n=1 Tax=Anabaena sphaerica FACHB-251 TaxID=2692883 RepID=A0A926WM73_9NOST|nr:hypothetical protein [Anabaena sphaerica]MBD2296702.1 hypothetical protein [Anabaena sphaerica FACHB-251]